MASEQLQERISLLMSAPLITCLALIVLAILKNNRGDRRLLLPGPRGWPVFGNVPHMGKFPIGTLRKFSQKYGPLYRVHFGSAPIVMVNSAQVAKEVLRTNDHITASRPTPPISAQFLSYNRLDILWSPYGPYWRDLRKICALKLFTAKRLHLFQGTRRTEILHALLDILEEAQLGKTMNMRTYFSNLTYNNMSAIVLGKRFRNLLHTNAPSTKDNYAVGMFQHGIEVAVKINISDVVPWLKPLDLQGIEKEVRNVYSDVDKYLQNILDEHTATASDSSTAKTERLSGNFVDLLLEISTGLTADFPGIKLSPSNIKAILAISEIQLTSHREHNCYD